MYIPRERSRPLRGSGVCAPRTRAIAAHDVSERRHNMMFARQVVVGTRLYDVIITCVFVYISYGRFDVDDVVFHAFSSSASRCGARDLPQRASSPVTDKIRRARPSDGARVPPRVTRVRRLPAARRTGRLMFRLYFLYGHSLGVYAMDVRGSLCFLFEPVGRA